MAPRFLQLHYLTSYPAALLNRDDVGFAKRIPFGGTTRTRISSQCLKRHWRTHEGVDGLARIEIGGKSVPMSVRSRRTFERYIHGPLIEEGVEAEIAEAAIQAVMEEVLGKSAKAASEEESAGVRTNQVTVLGRPEVDFLLEETRAICRDSENVKEVKKVAKERFKKEAKKNAQAMRCEAGLDAALFGRMVTSDYLARGDAAVHVAHAFTVHEEEAETDYFTAVDDLLTEGDEVELGSGHINTSELTSGLYYGYVVLDVPLLVSNLEGCRREEWQEADRDLAAEVGRRLIRLVATVSPGAKLGSTAPYSRAQFLLAEAGDAQPRTLANAFLRAVSQRGDLLGNTYRSLASHVGEMDAMYGSDEERCMAAVGPLEELDDVFAEEIRTDLQGISDWAGERIEGAS